MLYVELKWRDFSYCGVVLSANNGLYPFSLEQLVLQYLEWKTILDLESNLPYEYTHKEDGSYELCVKINFTKGAIKRLLFCKNCEKPIV